MTDPYGERWDGLRIGTMFREVVVASLVVCAVSSSSSVAAVDPSRFVAEVLAEGMPRPLEVEAAPDGRVFWIELGGRLRCVLPESPGEIVECGALEVFTEQEGGLIGMALDPGFSGNGWIYLHYSPPGKACNRVSRFTMRGDRLDPASEAVLVEIPVHRDECCHHAGSLEFGPDGCLFIATGDNTHPGGDSQGYAPIDERPGRGPYDAQKSSANLADLRGAVLRIRPLPEGGYEIPGGNLLAADGSGGRPELYVKGCRNPWRIGVDPATGFLYWGEVGPDAGGDGPRGPRGYDEINQAREAGFFGWPYFIADNRPYADVDFDTGAIGASFDPARPVNDAPRNTGPRELPPARPAWIYYPYAASPEFPAVGQGGRTACAGPVFRWNEAFAGHDGFPEEFDGCLVAYDWQRPFVFWARLDGNSDLAGLEPFDLPVTIRRPVDFDFDDHGVLHVLDYGETWGENADSKLVQVRYVRGNRAPLAALEVDPPGGAAPLELTASAAGSSDPDGDPLEVSWKVDGKVVSSEAVARLKLAEPGVRTIEVVVADPHGATASASTAVVVGNTPPTVAFLEPGDGGFVGAGEPIAFRLSVVDAEDGGGPSLLARSAVSAEWLAGESAGDEAEPAGFALIRASDCLNCHAVDHRLVGPGFSEVAERYRGVDGAVEASVERVVKGSTGVWGPIPMLPHDGLPRSDVREMVAWIHGLADASADDGGRRQAVAAAAGQIPPVVPQGESGRVRLTATATDAGAPGVPPLSATTAVILRTRWAEAEAADGFGGGQWLGEPRPGPERFFGAIPDGGWLRFAHIDLGQVGGVRCRFASGGPGGAIEFRNGAPDGPVLASIIAGPTGGWEQWESVEVRLPGSAGGGDRRPVDVYVVFANPGREHLMNLDAIEFLP